MTSENNVDTNADTKKMQINRADSFFVQSSKGLMILNAGAVVAILGLFQALYGKGDAASFKVFAVISGFLYLLGAISAVWMLWSRFEYIDGGSASKITVFLHGFGERGRGAFIISTSAFGLGTIFVLLGIACVVR